jgi:hypothetical protein
VDNNSLSGRGAKGWVIVHPGELCKCQTQKNFSDHFDSPL